MNNRLPIARMLTFGLLPGCVKKLIYRLEGNHIGRNVKIHIGAVVVSKSKFSIGDTTEIGFFTSISGHHICIGRRNKTYDNYGDPSVICLEVLQNRGREEPFGHLQSDIVRIV